MDHPESEGNGPGVRQHPASASKLEQTRTRLAAAELRLAAAGEQGGADPGHAQSARRTGPARAWPVPPLPQARSWLRLPHQRALPALRQGAHCFLTPRVQVGAPERDEYWRSWARSAASSVWPGPAPSTLSAEQGCVCRDVAGVRRSQLVHACRPPSVAQTSPMSHPLDSCRAKIARAEELWQKLGAALVRFLEERPHRSEAGAGLQNLESGLHERSEPLSWDIGISAMRERSRTSEAAMYLFPATPPRRCRPASARVHRAARPAPPWEPRIRRASPPSPRQGRRTPRR